MSNERIEQLINDKHRRAPNMTTDQPCHAT